MSEDAPSAGRFDGRIHCLPVRIYYEDTDFSGIVYHANYLRYFERGRSDFLRVAGIHHNELAAAADPTVFAVNKMELEFLRPARIDDALVVKTVFETMRGPRIFISQALEKVGRNLGHREGPGLLHKPHGSRQEAAGGAFRTA